MSSHPTVIRNAPRQDLINELHTFIKGALKIERCNPLDLTKTALRLLRNIPAARTALFEYFSRVFGEAASNYIQAVETEIKTGALPTTSETDETVVSEIHTVLSGFISDNPTAWAPIVSAWSLELLGEISTKFAGRAHISTNLNETLQLWMNCRATKVLVDINTKCLSSLMHSDTEACINALLDTSIKHSPNFDWVVAHVGSCFPNTVITRVLSCGLKDFCQIKSYEQGSNSPKLRSVVGILGHLAGSHSSDIRSAILEMFLWSLENNVQDMDATKLQKKATVPFILQLSFLSSTLFSSVCSDMKRILSVDIICKLYPFVDDWCKYFGSNEILEDLLLTLILSCDNGGIQIVNVLLDCISVEHRHSDTIAQNIKEKSLEILQNLIYRLDEHIRNGKSFEVLTSFAADLDEIHKNLLSQVDVRAQTAAQLVTFLGHNNPSLLVRSVSFLFQNSKASKHLSLLVKILSHELVNKTAWPYAEKGGYFSVVLEQILSRNIEGRLKKNEERDDLTQMWDNLLTLLQWEKSGRVSLLKSKIITKAILTNLAPFTSIFESEVAHVHVVSKILNNLDIPINGNLDSLPVEVILNLTQSTVNYFFICCYEEGTSNKAKGFERINRLLRRLCTHSKVARVLALRELLERALFRKDNFLFGAKNNGTFDGSSDKLLLKQNKKFNKTIPLTKHSSVFNGGIIGTGKRKLLPHNDLHLDVVAANTCELINAIKSCCSLSEDVEAKFSELSLESVTLVSLLLVQFVSPDVMYNGLPWPDEEFSKVTIERDLFIRRMFTNVPVLWDLLSFVGVYRPSLCYCSVLIRALIATLIHQWKSTGDQSKSNVTENYKALMGTTIKVIDVMALGQLLPPPLCSIRDVLANLKCFEIVAILKDCIWTYMRDHIPSPALFVCDSNGIHWRDPTLSRPGEMYTNTLRIIMQRNIETLGHMYSQMFINIPKHDLPKKAAPVGLRAPLQHIPLPPGPRLLSLPPPPLTPPPPTELAPLPVDLAPPPESPSTTESQQPRRREDLVRVRLTLPDGRRVRRRVERELLPLVRPTPPQAPPTPPPPTVPEPPQPPKAKSRRLARVRMTLPDGRVVWRRVDRNLLPHTTPAPPTPLLLIVPPPPPPVPQSTQSLLPKSKTTRLARVRMTLPDGRVVRRRVDRNLLPLLPLVRPPPPHTAIAPPTPLPLIVPPPPPVLEPPQPIVPPPPPSVLEPPQPTLPSSESSPSAIVPRQHRREGQVKVRVTLPDGRKVRRYVDRNSLNRPTP